MPPPLPVVFPFREPVEVVVDGTIEDDTGSSEISFSALEVSVLKLETDSLVVAATFVQL